MYLVSNQASPSHMPPPMAMAHSATLRSHRSMSQVGISLIIKLLLIHATCSYKPDPLHSGGCGGQQPGPADDAPLVHLLAGLGVHLAGHALPAAKQPIKQKQGT